MLKNQPATLANLERHVGEIASLLLERAPGKLLSNTETNPRGFAKPVMTRSGAGERDDPVTYEVTTRGVVEDPSVDGEEQVDEEIQMEFLPAKVHQRRSPASTAHAEKQSEPPMRVNKPKLPYPGRLKMDREEELIVKFLELLKQLHLKVPFLEPLNQMLKYSKFLKDILTNKQKLAKVSCVPLSVGCSAVLQSKFLEKKGDPGSFTIPCILGNDTVIYVLANLEANINLMSYFVFYRLGTGEPRPTRMSIQLTDRSVEYPHGIVDNMLVRIGKFIFPVDLVIHDMNEEGCAPLILGRPFLSTAHALIDVRDGKLILRDGDGNITFDV
ncbi:uncharacterized protein LOC143620601 [Bidens hawaiensis]|uniref:uncharacterized protein LOC143620601 n=1 Tax=Bidens hawaiensis TaxID=980011 RepID=UPI00404B09EA